MTHQMITPIYDSAKALPPSGSPDDPSCSPRAVCQRMPVTIRRRLRALTSSPRWRLTMLLSAMLFVGSSAGGFTIEGAANLYVNGRYKQGGGMRPSKDPNAQPWFIGLNKGLAKQDVNSGYYVEYDPNYSAKYGAWKLCFSENPQKTTDGEFLYYCIPGGSEFYMKEKDPKKPEHIVACNIQQVTVRNVPSRLKRTGQALATMGRTIANAGNLLTTLPVCGKALSDNLSCSGNSRRRLAGYGRHDRLRAISIHHLRRLRTLRAAADAAY